MRHKPYTIEWNQNEDTWNVISEQIRKDYIIKGLKEVKLAEQFADALNKAYEQGVLDEKESYRDKIKTIFDIH